MQIEKTRSQVVNILSERKRQCEELTMIKLSDNSVNLSRVAQAEAAALEALEFVSV